jgi:WD40 repeat protein
MPILEPLAPSLDPADPIVARWSAHRETIHALVGLGSGRVWSASEDGRAILWSVPDGVELHSLAVPGPVNHLAIDPAGGFLVSAHDDGTARLWDAQTGEAGPVLRGHEHYVRQVAIDERWVATACEDGYVRVFDGDGGLRHALGDGDGAWSAVLLTEGLVIASRRDNRVVVWDAASGEPRDPIYVAETMILGKGGWFLAVPVGERSEGHPRTGPTVLARGPDGLLWTAGEGLLGWELAGRRKVVERRAAWPIGALVVDERGIAAAADVVELWDPQGRHRQLPTSGGTALARVGRYLVVGGRRGEIVVLDPEIETPVARHASYVSDVTLAAEHGLAATGDSSGTVRVWDLDSGRSLAALRRWPEPNTHPFLFTADGRLVTSRDDEPPGITVWNPRTAEVLREIEGPPAHDVRLGVHGLGFAGARLLVGGRGGGVGLWDLEGDDHAALDGVTRQVSMLVTERSGRFVATLGWFNPEILEGGEATIAGTREYLQVWSLAERRLVYSVCGEAEGEDSYFYYRFGPLVAADGAWIARSGAGAGQLARWIPEQTTPVVLLELRGSIRFIGDLGREQEGAYVVHSEGEDDSATYSLTRVDGLLRERGCVELPADTCEARLVGERIAVARRSGEVLLLDLDGARIAACDLGEWTSAFAFDGERIVAVTRSGRVHVLGLR